MPVFGLGEFRLITYYTYRESDSLAPSLRSFLPTALMTWTLGTHANQPTIQLAIASITKVEDGKWKFAKSPGNGVTNRYFVCNAHKDCGRLLKVGKKDGMFCIFLDGEHTVEPSFGKRKNSTLSWADDDRLKRAVDQGAKPGGVHVSLSKAKALELEQDGLDPLEHKKDKGGLEGEHTHQPNTQYTCAIRNTELYLTVSRCVSRCARCVFRDAARIHVSESILTVLWSYRVLA